MLLTLHLNILFKNLFCFTILQAQNITWGKNRGCEFAMKSCKELMDNDINLQNTLSLEEFQMKKSPFCNTVQSNNAVTSCNHDRTSVGNCNLAMYGNSLPKIYQNFKKVGGVRRRDLAKV